MEFRDEHKSQPPASMVERVAKSMAVSLGQSEEAWRFYEGHARMIIAAVFDAAAAEKP